MAKSMRLVVVMGGQDGTVFEVQAGSNLIGRWDPDTSAYPEIDLENEDPEAKVSRKHAVLTCEDDSVTIEDIGSLNGTFLNKSERLSPHTRYEIQPGAEIIIGKTRLRFEVE